MNEIHESGDVVFEARQLWRRMGANNISWINTVGLPLAAPVADYYMSRASTRPGEGAQLHLDGVCGPDEHKADVNDSAYIIASALNTLETALEFAEFKARAEARGAPGGGDGGIPYNTSAWRDAATRLAPSLPFDPATAFHPEFDGMAIKGFVAKQADTVMVSAEVALPSFEGAPQYLLSSRLSFG